MLKFLRRVFDPPLPAALDEAMKQLHEAELELIRVTEVVDRGIARIEGLEMTITRLREVLKKGDVLALPEGTSDRCIQTIH